MQVLLNMLAFKYHPQAALDAPRICLAATSPEPGKDMDRTVFVEEGVSEKAVEGLKKKGHKIQVLEGWKRGMFGRGQIIRSHYDDGVLVYSAGSDPRGDGMAIPVV